MNTNQINIVAIEEGVMACSNCHQIAFPEKYILGPIFNSDWDVPGVIVRINELYFEEVITNYPWERRYFCQSCGIMLTFDSSNVPEVVAEYQSMEPCAIFNMYMLEEREEFIFHSIDVISSMI